MTASGASESPATATVLDASTTERIESRLSGLVAGLLSQRPLTPPEVRSLATELLSIAQPAPEAPE